MSIELGTTPDRLNLHLTTGADFEATLTYTDAAGTETNWPAGTTISLAFADGTSWAATISGTDATWAVNKATADVVASSTGVSLKYVNGTTDQTWAIGRVIRHG